METGASAEIGTTISDDAWFERFAADNEVALRRTLVAALGHESGIEAAAIALAYAWEHRARLSTMQNPAGYAYRVGRSRARRRRREPRFHPVPAHAEAVVEPGLPDALAALSEHQRAAVTMVHAAGWSRHEAAEALQVSVSTLDTHLARGLTRLRSELGVDADD